MINIMVFLQTIIVLIAGIGSALFGMSDDALHACQKENKRNKINSCIYSSDHTVQRAGLEYLSDEIASFFKKHTHAAITDQEPLIEGLKLRDSYFSSNAVVTGLPQVKRSLHQRSD